MSVSSVKPMTRRTTHKADETRELILTAAEQRFSAKGFYPTRLEDIAEDVGISRTAVIYHFQDKETLYNAVLGKRFSELNQCIDDALKIPASLPERVEAALEAWMNYTMQHPSLIRLFMREVASSEDGLRPEVAVHVGPMFAGLNAALAQGQCNNTFRAIEPVQFWSILAGAFMFFIMDAPLLVQSEISAAEHAARLQNYKNELQRIARHMLGVGDSENE